LYISINHGKARSPRSHFRSRFLPRQRLHLPHHHHPRRRRIKPVRRGESSCQYQIRKRHYLERCQWYMQQETGGCSTYNTQLLNSCCDQLQNLDEGCRCTGLKQAVREQLQEGQWESEEAKDMFDVAERALRKCDLEPRRCDMQSRRWF
ncbi:hypothetical protein Goklo_012829, partial [Gossypium klotzschianum]|nr:hypothetical protein [Gossypium klotzschianum]